MATPRILLGRIGPAHGIRGEVIIHSFAADPADIASYGPLHDAAGSRSFVLRVVRPTPKGIIVRIDGVTDRTAAEALRGVELFVERRQLPATAEDEFYHSDLIGLQAVSPEGQPIGKIVGVENYGAGDLLAIELAATGQSEFVLFSQAFVPAVDLAAGRVTVRLPDDAADPDEHGRDGTDRN